MSCCPCGCHTPACCCRLQPPQLRQKDGQLHVTLRLRRGADLSSVLRELASSLGAADRGNKGAAVREGDINMQVRRAASELSEAAGVNIRGSHNNKAAEVHLQGTIVHLY